MKITRVCNLDGQLYTMDIPSLTPDSLEASMAAYNRGALLQNAFPRQNAGEREFLKTGILPEHWDRLFGSEPTE